jgi:hypothetical protein
MPEIKAPVEKNNWSSYCSVSNNRNQCSEKNCIVFDLCKIKKPFPESGKGSTYTSRYAVDTDKLDAFLKDKKIINDPFPMRIIEFKVKAKWIWILNAVLALFLIFACVGFIVALNFAQ